MPAFELRSRVREYRWRQQQHIQLHGLRGRGVVGRQRYR
jgi:hypothetical protein